MLFPSIGGNQIAAILGAGLGLAALCLIAYALREHRRAPVPATDLGRAGLQRARLAWRTPSLDSMGPMELTTMRRVFMVVLRAYLMVAVGMVVMRVIQAARGV